jgi:hypothetical protein
MPRSASKPGKTYQGARVEYDFSELSEEQRAVLEAVLKRDAIPHRWRSSVVIVPND